MAEAFGAGGSSRLATVSTVVTAADSHDMTDVQTIKDELSLAGNDTSRDAVLSRYIADASRSAEQYCNRTFVVETINDRIFPPRDNWLRTVVDGVEVIQLSRWPVVSIASVTEDGTALTQDTDFILDAARGQLIRLDGNGYPTRWSPVTIIVQFDAGYATIPSDLSAAVIRMAVQRWFARVRDPLVKSEIVEGIGRTDYIVSNGADGNMSSDVIDLLDNYRIPVVA